ncbi:polysaccharide biosynthesis C-terminal domain-containing protein [Afifella marina]|uniref:Membrane protein involved in the export of O-antigen and teichoic acid n=1 Tax=Afifella marina DSM 2698 TaxID=1120955 RepID=A0A1G5MCA0_AFIMA|nr:polysaccharide biosynthesis C-terminal domain-containing protein [Afifella marina]SCZ22040.1 Membrane protein involved in the export of O-antigen and teichoic acid [Afifella marina DSM 2698]
MIPDQEMPAGRVRGFLALARNVLANSDERARARRASLIALTLRVGNAVLAYGTQVVLARLMGQFEYGIFAFTWVWLLVFGAISTLGFGDSPVRYVAALRETGEEDQLRGFLRFAGIVSFAAPVVFAVLFALGVYFAGSWIENAYVYPLLLMAVAMPFGCFQAYLEDVGRAYFWTIPALFPVYILRHALILVYMVAAVALGFEASAVTAFACTILAMATATVWQSYQILGRLRKTVPAGPRAYRPKEWFIGSAPFAVLQGMFHLFAYMAVIVLSFFVSPAQIGIYFAATRIVQVVAFIPYAASVGSAHLFSASHAAGDQARLTTLTREVSLVTFVASTGVTILVVTTGMWLLQLFGDGFETGYNVLLILSVGMVARAIFGPAEDILNMTGFSHLSATTYVVMVVINGVLNVALIIPFGITGAAIATTLALTIRSVWLAWAVRQRLGLDTSIVGAWALLAETVGRWRKGKAAKPAQ